MYTKIFSKGFGSEYVAFHHHGDFSGDIKIEKQYGDSIEIDFEALKFIVAEYMRENRISSIEDMNTDKILGVD